MKIDVLDSGFVRLVDHMGDDLSIVRAARVSYDADWRAGADSGSDARLIDYLMRNKHTSPFESVTFTFEVKAPIFIFRQWHRHRTWSFNEISARYAELDEGFYVPKAEHIGTQSKDNKQCRDIAPEASVAAQLWEARIKYACRESVIHYKMLLEEGCPREIARTVLPVAAYSRMFATVDLHNLMHFLRLRMPPHAQFEMRTYAQALHQLAATVTPRAIASFDKCEADH